MSSARPQKKTDTIEIRLADEVKVAFAAKCRQEGRTVSEAIRALIADNLEPSGHVRQAPPARWRLGLAGVLGVALGAGVAAPSFARSVCDSHPVMEYVVSNADAVSALREPHKR